MSLEINNETIDDDILVEEFNYVKENYQAHIVDDNQPLPNDKDLMILVKENVIRRCLLRQEVENQDITIEEEILEKEITITKSLQADQGLEEEEIREHVLLKCKIDKILVEVSNDILEPEEKHLKQFFLDNHKYYDGLQQVELAQIVKKFNNDIEKKEILAELNSYKKKIEINQNTFEEVVENYSNVKSNGGYLGYLEVNLMGSKLKQIIENLNINEITSPYIENNYIYLFKLLNKKEVSSDDFSVIKEQVKNDLMNHLKEKKIDIYITKLMEKSEIIDNQSI